MEINPAINQSTTFGRKSVSITRAENLMRRVRQEFPTYSGSKMQWYGCADKTDRVKTFRHFTGMCNHQFRQYYYSGETARGKFYREILGMKKNKIGNCGELSDATVMALKMNGYKDAKKVGLYAYNPNTGRVRDIDHNVAVIGLKNKEKSFVERITDKITDFMSIFGSKRSSRKFIKPNKDVIIIDSWAGFADKLPEAQLKYRTKSWASGFARNKNNVNTLDLKPDEVLMFELEKDSKIDNTDIAYFKKVFPNLLLKNKVAEPTIMPDIRGLSRSEMNGIRIACKMQPVEYEPITYDNRLECPAKNEFSLFENIKNILSCA